jgi:hypothetical protein
MNYEGLLEGITLAHSDTMNGVARVVDRPSYPVIG